MVYILLLFKQSDNSFTDSPQPERQQVASLIHNQLVRIQLPIPRQRYNFVL